VTTQVNLYEAKTHLSDLVERAARGEDIVIAKAGRPKVRLVAVEARTTPRTAGVWRGRITMSPDFDDSLADLLGGTAE